MPQKKPKEFIVIALKKGGDCHDALAVAQRTESVRIECLCDAVLHLFEFDSHTVVNCPNGSCKTSHVIGRVPARVR